MKTHILHKLSALILLLSLALPITACTSKDEIIHRGEIFALDTLITITAYGEKGTEGITGAKNEIRRLEKLLGVTEENSDISRINTSNGKAVEVSKETYALIETAVKVSLLTEGKFDPSIYPVMKLWGFTDKNFTLPKEEDIKYALKLVNYEKIEFLDGNRIKLPKDYAIDLGGIAKGYIADMTALKMKETGVESGTISLGGNVKTFGKNPNSEVWTIGVNHPDDNMAFCKVKASEGSLVTSGAYQRNFTFEGVTYHHIIDPSTGYSAESDIRSVTIYSKDGSLADGLSTALFIGGTDYAKRFQQAQNNFEYIILTKNNTLEVSRGLRGKIELLENYRNIDINYN